jgi:hypothetical protein
MVHRFRRIALRQRRTLSQSLITWPELEGRNF